MLPGTEDVMAELKVRQVGESVVAALKARARRRGVSLEEEIRATLSASMAARRTTFARRAAALRRASGDKPGKPRLDSARLIRRERDAGG